jgi:HlyD family secretion protein
MKKIFLFTTLTVIAFACKPSTSEFDASGAFEAEETIISSEATGMLKEFTIQEGQELKAGQYIGYVDSMQLYLRKQQIEAQIRAVLGKKPNINTQVASLEEQLSAAEREQRRVANLVKAEAATQKQLDDFNAQVEVLRKQIAAQRSALGTTSSGITLESLPLQEQIKQVNDQLAKSRIVNPMNGTVLMKYAEANEVVIPGKPLYKIADLSTVILRAYVTGAQLPAIKLNQPVTVLVDNGPDTYAEYKGTITWISDKAEFTPKTIQTKEERANLVYAIKIKVPNPGNLKIGMYGEVKFK